MWMLIIVLLSILIAQLSYLNMKKPNNYPPGPKWLPILGSTLTIRLLRKRTGYLYRAIICLAESYGPIVGLKVGKDMVVICSSYSAIKEMLTKDEFEGRPQGPFYETRTWGTRRGLLLTDEEFWVEQRRFVLRHLREFGFGKRTMAKLVQEEVIQLVEDFKEKIMNSKDGKGEIMEMRDAFSVGVLNTLWSMMASKRYNADDKELKDLQALLTELFANIDMVGALFSQFPFLRYIAPKVSGYKTFVDIHQQVWKFLRAELDDHKETFILNQPRDLMDVYLQMLQSQEKKESYSESQLLAICMDLFMAGSETSSKTLGFGFLYLLLNPEVQKKAQKEIDSVVGRDRLPTLNDRPNMPYVEALVLESLRVFTGRAFAVPHRALRDTTLEGYYIPKDTTMIANLAALHNDVDIWDHPDRFCPERFISCDGEVIVPDEYLPFGYGKHFCMGQSLAKTNIFLFFACLLHTFNFSIPDGQAPPSTLGVDGITPSPGKFSAYVSLRS